MYVCYSKFILFTAEVLKITSKTYLLHNPTVEQVSIHWTVFVFHGQYWIIIGKYCSILSDNVKEVHTAGLNSLGDVIIGVV